MAVLYVFPVANTEFVQFNDQNNDYITSIHYSELSFGLDNNSNVQFSHRRESAQLFPIKAAPFAEVLNEAGTPYSAVSLPAFVAAFTAALPLSGAAAGGGGGGSAPDIATFTFEYDAVSEVFIKVLTVFDPITNVPTRTFFELDGVTPYFPINISAVIDPTFSLIDISNNITNIKNGFKIGSIVSYSQQIVDNTSNASPDARTIIGVDIQKMQIIALVGTFTITNPSAVQYPLTTANGVIDSFTLDAPDGRFFDTFSYEVGANSKVLEVYQY